MGWKVVSERREIDDGGYLTNGYHALAIIVQILLDNLQQTLNRPPSAQLDLPASLPLPITLFLPTTTPNKPLPTVPAQILILLLHLGKRHREPSHHPLVGDLVDIALDDQPKVEDELVALVLGVGDGDGEAEHRVLGVGVIDGNVPVEEGVAWDDVLLEDVKIEETWFWCPGGGRGTSCCAAAAGGGGWHNAAWRALCNDLRAYIEVSIACCDIL